MSDEPLISPIDYPARLDRRSHIEQICPLPHGESIAWLPRAARWHPPGTQMELEPREEPDMSERKRYMLLEKAYYGEQIRWPGEVVELLDHEVGPHHQLIEEPSGIEALSEEAKSAIAEALEATPPKVLAAIEKDTGLESIEALHEKVGADLQGEEAEESETPPPAKKRKRVADDDTD